MTLKPNPFLQNMLHLAQLRKLTDDRRTDDDRIAALYQKRHADQEDQFIDRVHDAAADMDSQHSAKAEVLRGIWQDMRQTHKQEMARLRIGNDLVNDGLDRYRRMRGLPEIDSSEVRRARRERIEEHFGENYAEQFDAHMAGKPDPATDKSAHRDDTASDVAAAVQELSEQSHD